VPGGSAAEVPREVASLDELFQRHSAEAWRLAFSVTRNREDASDAVAEAFAKVLAAVAARPGDTIGDLRAYLMAATRNAALDVVRRRVRLVATDQPALDQPSPATGPFEQVAADDDRDIVLQAFAGLPPRWREVLWLTEVQGMPPREAAELLQLSANNVAQLASRARSRLRQHYVQYHVRNHASGDCAWTVEHLGALVAGELTDLRADRVTAHLADCADCRARRAELDDLGLTLRRAALPLALTLRRSRIRTWRRIVANWSHGAGDVGLATTRSSTVGMVAAASDLAASPVLQSVAAVVTAGLLALGVGAATVRRDTPGSGPSHARALEAAAPLSTAPSVPPLVTTVATDLEPATTLPPPSTTTTLPAPPPTTAAASTATAAVFAPRGPLAAAQTSLVARAVVPVLSVYDAAGTPAGLTLANPLASGSPLVMLVTAQQGDWVQVLLPVRPNGSTGWLRRDDVELSAHDYMIVVELGAHRITAYHGTEVLLSEPVAVGTSDAPTPDGLYYTTELIKPTDAAGNYDPGGPYGPYAYPMSGFSDVLFDFAGGDGQFGIHGTNDPSALGRDVSHGCIRMSNPGISFLARILPAGVPVRVVP
jgi:RNA polymerase sigma factor (sigma-70 family)